GQVSYRNDKNGIIHTAIGKVDFDVSALKENLTVLLADLKKVKPTSTKGVYMKKVTISTTMGPGLVIDHAELDV
ncbi:50S ribosomal protein L1, partial [Wenyingzhuangia sp. 1_MG-2023]|nr:50S ribosomal protein L1 [Wenyingzhuangia sp. 1_MG-2023]